MFLNGANYMERNLTGAALGVVGATFVVVKQEGIDQNAGVTWGNTCMFRKKLSVY